MCFILHCRSEKQLNSPWRSIWRCFWWILYILLLIDSCAYVFIFPQCYTNHQTEKLTFKQASQNGNQTNNTSFFWPKDQKNVPSKEKWKVFQKQNINPWNEGKSQYWGQSATVRTPGAQMIQIETLNHFNVIQRWEQKNNIQLNNMHIKLQYKTDAQGCNFPWQIRKCTRTP